MRSIRKNSELRVLVYRAGALANLGHNHVMVNHGVTGAVQVGATLDASSFTLQVPVEAFVVDEAEARREEGSDFEGDIAEEAKAGTRLHMLSAALLDAAEVSDDHRQEGVTLERHARRIERRFDHQRRGT